MKKTILRLLCVLLSLSLLASITACGGAAGYTVTGEVEDGELVVWLSPMMTMDRKPLVNGIVRMMETYYEYNPDLKLVEFDSNEEFRQALAQKIITGDGPDLILASPYELTSKLFKSESLMDLTPLFEYEYQNGTMDESDIMTSIFEAGTFEGKLLAVPLTFQFGYIDADATADAEQGLDLQNQPNLTTAEYLNVYNDWLTENGELNEFKISSTLPPVELAFQGFIDYEAGTTRMGEDQVYDYFCKYINCERLLNSGAFVDIYEELTGVTVDATNDTKARIWLNEQKIYFKSNLPADAINQRGSNRVALPCVTGDGDNGFLVKAYIAAAIPANAKKKEKAFSFIKVAFNKDFLYLNSSDFQRFGYPMLKSVIKETLGNADLYQLITENKFAFVWMDSQVQDWLSEYIISTEIDEETNYFIYPQIPTRDEWNALKKKIELYLNE